MVMWYSEQQGLFLRDEDKEENTPHKCLFESDACVPTSLRAQCTLTSFHTDSPVGLNHLINVIFYESASEITEARLELKFNYFSLP